MAVIGRVFNIQRFSTHDGPGIRTTVFFKGCNLHCKWCHNPESISMKPQLELNTDLCIGCGACFHACPFHMIDESGAHIIDRYKCTGCGKCTDTCYAKALTPVGKDTDTDELMKDILTDKMYFDLSNGGVTFSGGECMIQPDFLSELVAQCRKEGVHTAVDTAGNVPWSYFEKVDADMYLYDLKAVDPTLHKKLVGVDNKLILENLKRLSDAGKRMWIRIPYVPDCNDGEIPAMAEFLRGITAEKIELLPYHRLGEGKYDSLGIERGDAIRTPTDEELDRAVEYFNAHGVNVIRQ
ncbi:MAG: glycyl-radical enzyme activating protein [Clostridia bacterium]|nr:glycyl-radical enzyme activating protein [Clostridia bacterium]